MLATGIVCPLALVFILLADWLALLVVALVAAAAIAGAFALPVTVLTRNRGAPLTIPPSARPLCPRCGVDRLAFTLGPVLVAVLLAIACRALPSPRPCSGRVAVPVFALPRRR
jgi:hypothetical protein